MSHKIIIFGLFCLQLVFLGRGLNAEKFALSEELQKFYETGRERTSLFKGWGRLEKARTEIILNQSLPKPPATILDVGGGMGVYAFNLAQRGYSVYLIDPVPFHIEEAKKIGQKQRDFPLKNYLVGDARKIEMEDNSADVVLFFGPLYHLDTGDRQIALSEAYRVLGLVKQ